MCRGSRADYPRRHNEIETPAFAQISVPSRACLGDNRLRVRRPESLSGTSRAARGRSKLRDAPATPIDSWQPGAQGPATAALCQPSVRDTASVAVRRYKLRFMSTKRQAIIDTAGRLFSAHGYHAVGIDRVVAEARVAKMTLYNHFSSKDDLIVQVLREWGQGFRRRLFSFVDRFDEPEERLAAVFSWHDRWFKAPDFNGCMFVSAAAEFPDCEDGIHRAAVRHKREIHEYLAALLVDLEEAAADGCMTAQLGQILDGAIVAAQLMCDKDAAVAAWRSAVAVLCARGIGQADALSQTDIRTFPQRPDQGAHDHEVARSAGPT